MTREKMYQSFQRFFFLCIGIGLLGGISAQDCRTYMPTEAGNQVELTTYNKKGKETGKTIYTIKESTDLSDGIQFNMEMELQQPDGDVLTSNDVKAECRGGTYFVDVQAMIDPSVYARFQSMEVSFSGTPLQFPKDMSEGQILPDADVQLETQGTISINATILVKNRKVIAEESITTPAGTFYCYVITYDSELQAGLSMKSSSKQWISGEIGIVKQENFNKSGKLTSSMELTALVR
ncbi:MAG: hypothetical protein AAF587_38015 [Bacteroidota bacterium]